MKSEAIETMLASYGSKATYTGAGASIASGWWLSSQAGVLYGVLLGIAGMLLNGYFKRRAEAREQEALLRREKREQLEHEVRMRQLESNPDGVPRPTL